jgi:hypothetical protein
MNRNLNGLVLAIELNAWRDVREGRRLIRHWRHFLAGRTDSGSISSEAVADLGEKAYSEVSSWSVEDLEEREILGHSQPQE